MKKVKLFEDFLNEGKYNTVAKVIKAVGRNASEEEIAEFIYSNFKDVTGEDSKDDIESSDRVADIIGSYKFDIEEWLAAWKSRVAKG